MKDWVDLSIGWIPRLFTCPQTHKLPIRNPTPYHYTSEPWYKTRSIFFCITAKLSFELPAVLIIPRTLLENELPITLKDGIVVVAVFFGDSVVEIAVFFGLPRGFFFGLPRDLFSVSWAWINNITTRVESAGLICKQKAQLLLGCGRPYWLSLEGWKLSL